jgi:hypothetical protein
MDLYYNRAGRAGDYPYNQFLTRLCVKFIVNLERVTDSAFENG